MAMNLVCKYNLSGSCRNGKSCSFSHLGIAPRQMSAKKVICKYFPKGKCAYGDQCSKAHVASVAENANQAPGKNTPSKFTSDHGSDGGTPPNTVDFDCSPVVGQSDSQSDDVHSDQSHNNGYHISHREESLPEPITTINSSNEKCKSQCVFYIQGLCQAGDNCDFLHSSPQSSLIDAVVHEPTKGQSSRVVCKHFQRGFCRLGNKCKNLHALPNKGATSFDQPSSDSDSPPASETHSSIFNDSQPDFSDTQMNTSTEQTNDVHQECEGIQDDGSQSDDNQQEDDEQGAEAGWDDQYAIQTYETENMPPDTNDANGSHSEDPSGQWTSHASNTGISSPNISPNPQQTSDRELQPDVSQRCKGPGSYYGDEWMEEDAGSPQWPIPSSTSVPHEENTQIPGQSLYPHISEVSPHWSQFADPYADPLIPFCKFHAQGRCIQNDSCRFRHSLTPQEYTILFLDQQPNLWTLRRLPNTINTTNEYHTPPAYVVPTQSIQQPAVIASPVSRPFASTSRQECLFYSRGKCHNGSNCPFQHSGPPPDLPSANSETDDSKPYKRSYNNPVKICKYFASGHCKIGRDCKFLHEGGDDNGKAPLEANPSLEPVNKQAEEDSKWGNSWDDAPNAADWEVKPVDDSGWGAPVDYSGWETIKANDDHPQKEVCHQFSKYGSCRGFQNCRFSHDLEPTTSTTNIEDKKPNSENFNKDVDNSPSGPRSVSPVLPCPHFLRGGCKFEETCEFSHDDPQRYQTHAILYQRTTERSPTPAQLPEPEEEAEEGERDWDETLPAQDVKTQTIQSKILRPCKFFVQGHCKDGNDCRYMHTDSADYGVQNESEKSCADKSTDEQIDPIYVASLDEVNISADEKSVMEADKVDDGQFEPVIFDHPIVNSVLMNCEVTIGSDSSPSQITTMSDCNKIILSDLPEAGNAESIREICRKFGAIHGIVNIEPTRDPSVFQVQFAETSQAVSAVKSINNQSIHGKSITATLKARMPLTIRDVADQLVLKVTWPSPSQSAWIHYPTVTKAKQVAESLNDTTFRGRNIKAMFVKPLRSQKDAFALKIDRLPVDVTKSELEELCTGNTLININPPTYTEDASDAILSALDDFGGLDTFDPLKGNEERTTSVAFAVFKSDIMAKAAMKSLDSKEQIYLGTQSMTIRPTYYSRYRIVRDQLEAIQSALDMLTTNSDKRCTIQVDDHHDTSLAWIRMYAPLEAGPRFHAELKDLISGTVVKSEDGTDLWDDYFDLPSSAKALKQLSNAFIHRDLRTKQLKVYGSNNERKEAQKVITKLLTMVHSQKHEIDIPRQKLRPLINGSLAILKTDLGLNKVSLDVVKSRLIVRGTSNDVSKARAVLDSLHPDPSPPLSKYAGCQICLHTPTDAVTLSCHHRYCTSCLQSALQQIGHAPVRCIAQLATSDDHSEQCSTYVPYTVIRNVLVPTDEKDFLLASFLRYVRENPDELFCCPALNCQATYRRSGEKGINLKCKFCLSDVCTYCESFAHVGLSC